MTHTGSEIALFEKLENNPGGANAIQNFVVKNVKSDRDNLISQIFKFAMAGFFVACCISRDYRTVYFAIMGIFITNSAICINSLYNSYMILNPSPILSPATTQ